MDFLDLGNLCFPYVLGHCHEADANKLVPIPFVMTAPPKRLCSPYVLDYFHEGDVNELVNL